MSLRGGRGPAVPILKRTFNAKLHVLGYPQLFPATAAEQGCAKLKPWKGEQDLLREVDDRMNRSIATAAANVGVTFVDVASRFAGHEVCGKLGEWLNGPSFTVKIGRKFLDDESFHPNLTGQQMGYAGALNDAIH